MADDNSKKQRVRPPKSRRSFSEYCRIVESFTIIPFIEAMVRIWYHLDPRVYSERLRIRSITEGTVEKKSNRYAIFVLYEKVTLPAFTMNLINAINRSALNLIVVSNLPLEPLLKAQLLEKCNLLIERSNLGRDFGAYRDGISILLRRLKNIERLVLLNDSLFYFDRNLDDFVAGLNSEADFIGVTEVFQFHYHVQSFALSFSARILRNKRFLRYWRRYRPISSRRWSIHKGEVALTRKVTKAGFRPHILFHGGQLIALLRGRPIGELFDAIELLPTALRPQIYEDSISQNERYSSQPAAPIGIGQPGSPINAMFEVARRLRFAKGDDAALAEHHNASIQQLQRLSERTSAMDKLAVDAVWQDIVSTISARNQIHIGGFLFMKHLGLPVIKRDILYREVYALEDVHRILSEFGEPLRDEIMADLRRGGTAANLKGLWKLLHYHGSI